MSSARNPAAAKAAPLKASKTFTKKYSIPERLLQPLQKDQPKAKVRITKIKSPKLGSARVKLSSGGIARMRKDRGSQDVTPALPDESQDNKRS